MKILMVNKFHYIKGGSETYYFALKRMLETKGHEVVDFSMKDERNFYSEYKDYFVENVDYNTKNRGLVKLKIAMNIIYSFEAKKKLKKLIMHTKPDIIHLHIFQHQMSPSILGIAKKYNIPVVYTAHDLKMVCLNYKMMHHGIGCEDCKIERYWNCAKNRCVKDSFSKSCINVAEGYLHKILKSYAAINCIITPSKFYKKKFIEFGIEEDRIYHIPNFLDRKKPIINYREDREKYFLYFGRLSDEKGILTLIKAVKDTEIPLYIVGTGPLENEIKEYIENYDCSNIVIFGFKNGQELIDLVGNSKAVILPSEWYENGPYSAIEALQLGRPIIGADIGGIPELVDGNGYLFDSGDEMKLKEAIFKIYDMKKEQYQELKLASETLYRNTYTQKVHYPQLIEIYESLVKKNRN